MKKLAITFIVLDILAGLGFLLCYSNIKVFKDFQYMIIILKVKLSQKINDKVMFDSFFEGSYIRDINNDTIVVVVNSALAATLMKTKYYDLIQATVNDVTDYNLKLDFGNQCSVIAVFNTFICSFTSFSKNL